MSEQLDNILGSLSDDEVFALSSFMQDLETLENEDPILKHKDNNLAQQNFRALKSRYRFITGGNKIGKTDELGWEVAVLCKGRGAEFGIAFPHKPPLRIWYCGRDRNVLSDEPLKSITRYLKGDGIDYRVVWGGGVVQKMYIWDDEDPSNANGKRQVVSEITFKPYNGDIGIFESANVHLVLMDEEPPREVFSAIKPKIAVLPGYVLGAMTPDKGMSWTHDLFSGIDSDHGDLALNGQLERHQATVFENMMNFAAVDGMEWVRYPSEFVDRIEGFQYRQNPLDDSITEVYAPDTFKEYITQYRYGSNEYQMRILGRYVSFSGKVYQFEEKNIFDLYEVPPLSSLKFFGGLDYGFKDQFAYLLFGIDKDDCKWCLGEVYASYLDAREQAKQIKELNEYWGVRPESISADLQIGNVLPQKDAAKAHIQSVKDYYMDELGNDYTIWRTEAMDKRNPHEKRDMIRRDLEDGKLRFLRDKCFNVIQELQRLEFSRKSKDQDKTSGADHAEAALRYFYGAAFTYKGWVTEAEVAARKIARRVAPDVGYFNPLSKPPSRMVY